VAQMTAEQYVEGVLAGDRAMIGRAVTLIESTAAKHRELAAAVLHELMPASGGAHRIGLTGVPGVGKSTFVDALGSRLVDDGHRVAVLAVDPTSTRTRGSILGDKTRMARLAVSDAAFIRPSPSAGTLGGVARATRETMLVLEAAGFDVVIVETVGVGQSEVTVRDMVDIFVVLMLPGAGDALQGIKKGVLELADLLVVNKADGERVIAAEAAAREYRNALRILQPSSPDWTPVVQLASAIEGTGLADVWDLILQHRDKLGASGALSAQRRDQQVRWMWAMVEDRLVSAMREHVGVTAMLETLEAAVAAGEESPSVAADRLLRAFFTG